MGFENKGKEKVNRSLEAAHVRRSQSLMDKAARFLKQNEDGDSEGEYGVENSYLGEYGDDDDDDDEEDEEKEDEEKEDDEERDEDEVKENGFNEEESRPKKKVKKIIKVKKEKPKKEKKEKKSRRERPGKNTNLKEMFESGKIDNCDSDDE